MGYLQKHKLLKGKFCLLPEFNGPFSRTECFISVDIATKYSISQYRIQLGFEPSTFYFEIQSECSVMVRNIDSRS